MLPSKFLEIRVSKMAISSILRQMLYSFKTSFLLVDFVFVQKNKTKLQKEGGRGEGGTGSSGYPFNPPLALFSSKSFKTPGCYANKKRTQESVMSASVLQAVAASPTNCYY